ncbi:DUF6059 family protein [Streptomyces pactum]|uniref:Uncharacterized protein n=1 Tax=Streptomyces pactum TaxID=68249 RepID=A0A1S6JII9_9ACTN|nr:DUF6059 family protein [Streptomyces pactum]AQS65688.1 hypothetical protein B1H29_00875 [Streptomyces pactum]AQS71568.1 hypothetical protein B1H29_36190 [Streptomyces pactum]
MTFARRVRRFTRALVADVWQCLVAVGAVQLAGETARADTRLVDAPAPGHPERLRPDLPLTALERALLKDIGPAG